MRPHSLDIELGGEAFRSSDWRSAIGASRREGYSRSLPPPCLRPGVLPRSPTCAILTPLARQTPVCRTWHLEHATRDARLTSTEVVCGTHSGNRQGPLRPAAGRPGGSHRRRRSGSAVANHTRTDARVAGSHPRSSLGNRRQRALGTLRAPYPRQRQTGQAPFAWHGRQPSRGFSKPTTRSCAHGPTKGSVKT
jgi:hypothetical protein